MKKDFVFQEQTNLSSCGKGISVSSEVFHQETVEEFASQILKENGEKKRARRVYIFLHSCYVRC